MASRSGISMRDGFLSRLTALVLLVATLPGCLATSWNESIINGEITLHQGQVQFRIENKGFLWTDADAECGLLAGDVVATNVKLRK